MNVIGVLVQTTPDREAEVQAQLAGMPGVEVHASAGDGRLVVTAVDLDTANASDALMAMQLMPHVVAASLVYHAFEPETQDPEAGIPAARRTAA
jgi:nitrate reductase NapD